MLKALALFAAGYYFGRNPGAGRQVVAAGSQILDAYTDQPVARNVLPDTTIVTPQQAGACPPGYVYYAGGLMGAGCVDQATYEALMSGQLVQAGRPR